MLHAAYSIKSQQLNFNCGKQQKDSGYFQQFLPQQCRTQETYMIRYHSSNEAGIHLLAKTVIL